MTRYENLQKGASELGYTVGTFSTHGLRFYDSSVLYVAVGEPSSRHSHLILATWDTSYSMGRRDTGKNKWATALTAAEKYLREHPIAPVLQELERAEQQRRAEQRRKTARARRTQQRQTQRERATLLAQLRPTTLRAVADRIPGAVLDQFGMDEREHDELLDETNLIAELDGSILVQQTTLHHGRGWYRITDPTTAAPVIALG